MPRARKQRVRTAGSESESVDSRCRPLRPHSLSFRTQRSEVRNLKSLLSKRSLIAETALMTTAILDSSLRSLTAIRQVTHSPFAGMTGKSHRLTYPSGLRRDFSSWSSGTGTDWHSLRTLRRDPAPSTRTFIVTAVGSSCPSREVHLHPCLTHMSNGNASVLSRANKAMQSGDLVCTML